MTNGREWIVDAYDCPANRIAGEAGREALTSLFANVIRSVGLHPVGQAVWQLLPGSAAGTAGTAGTAGAAGTGGAAGTAGAAGTGGAAGTAGAAVGGAVTGMVALVESHLTCHSDPANSFLSLNLLSNRTELTPDFEGLLTRFVGARRVDVRVIERGGQLAPAVQPSAGAAVAS